jgi:hypothetical protein
LLALLACATSLGVSPAGAAAASAARPGRTCALLVFLAAGESQLASVPGLSVGIMSASQGSYTRTQLLLDIGQGARVASSAYSAVRPPSLSLRSASGEALLSGWTAARRRAEDAPQLLRPGLLAAQVPGGGAYAGIAGQDHLDAAVAADRAGRIAAVSIGSVSSLPARIAALMQDKRLVAADLPDGARGLAVLRALTAARSTGELLLVVQRLPGTHGELLWSAAAGLPGGGARELSSKTTNERGLLAAVDLAPTILEHLRLAPIPTDVRGRALLTDGALRSWSLRALMARLRVIGPRRLRALACVLLAWALALALAAPWPHARARALRGGAIGVLWAPVVVLIPAALEPSAGLEYAIVAVGCLALGALTDVLLAWPRAPIAPALVTLVALVLDSLSGTQLLMRSLLGPDPILGARFYGIGNELKSGLAVLVLAALASALYPAVRARAQAAAMLAAGVVLALVEGSARIGAGVGGAILVSAAFAVASVMLMPGALTRRRALIVLLSPLVALLGLAAVDLAAAHGTGHFSASVLHARSAADVRDILVRRYTAAWLELKNHAMPLASVLALGCAAWGLRRAERLLAPVQADPAWLAALAGGLTGGVVGALVEDSGPLLLVVAVFALGCVCSYLWGRPLERAPALGRAGGRRPAPR